MSPASDRPAPTLPPTLRDFDIHKMHLVQFASTRTIALKHGISQTRVRQIVQRVNHWLAASLPVKTDAEVEQETRLAQHLAADQLRNQLEELRILWDGTHDPKYFRQQTRVVTALARLGIVPGTIEALSADATIGEFDPHEPQPPWSEDDPWINSSSRHTPCAEASQPETWNLKPETVAPSGPPSEDCSPSSPHTVTAATALADPSDATAEPAEPSAQSDSLDLLQSEGLNLLEQRLLTLLENVLPDDTARRESLSRTLQIVRGEKASLQIRLAPHSPPVVVPLATLPSSCHAPEPIS